jgi:hypothetical protein
VSEAGHEATGPGEGISLGLPTWVFKRVFKVVTTVNKIRTQIRLH